MGAIQELISLELNWRAPDSEGVLKVDEEIGKYQSSGKTTYGPFLKISKHESYAKIFKINSNLKGTLHAPIENWSTLFGEIIAFNFENQRKD